MSRPPASESRQSPGTQSLNFSLVETPDQAIKAWSVVYQAYRRLGLIAPNPHEIHAVPQLFQRDSATVVGCIQGVTANTVSVYKDSHLGLPLDDSYAAELAKLRREGKPLVEFGMFGDRRSNPERSLHALLELMRFACGITQHFGVQDAVIGVHPHHEAYYVRLLGFRRIGPIKTHSLVNDKPVVLLHLDWAEATRRSEIPRGISYFQENVLSQDLLAGRLLMDSCESSAFSTLRLFVQRRDESATPGCRAA